MSDGKGRASSAVCCGMCLCMCVRDGVWVGARQCMRLQICQSTSLCVCHSIRVALTFCPFSPPCRVAFPQFCLLGPYLFPAPIWSQVH